jgi:hypothetical protein
MTTFFCSIGFPHSAMIKKKPSPDERRLVLTL